EFYRNGTLIGTDTATPYNFVWTNAQKGSYKLFARATDNSGNTTDSATISISVTNSPNSVNKARGKATTLITETAQMEAYAGAADTPFTENPALAADISSLTSDIQQAYNDFKSEYDSFGTNGPLIDAQLTAALLFSKASNGLAMRAANSPSIKNDLYRVASHLAISEDLMRRGVISTATITQAIATNTKTNIVVSSANIGYSFSTISAVAPGGLTSISTSGNVQ